MAVNGTPIEGFAVVQYQPRVAGAATFTPGRSIADLGEGCQIRATFTILQPDGNSPVEVTVNEKPALLRNAIGWPTMTNVYRVDFVVFDGIAPGMAAVGLKVAWVNGPEVNFPVR